MGAFTSPSVRQYGPACFLPNAHAEAIGMEGALDLVALCDPDPEGMERAGELHSVKHLYADTDALMASGAPDLIGLATRTMGRADIILECIASGTRALHVEKPLCNSHE